jgi:ubiquinone/menaquinone biosynthesis C-methylase UbiE
MRRSLFIYFAAAFKNFAQPVEALNEMHRVLRPGTHAKKTGHRTLGKISRRFFGACVASLNFSTDGSPVTRPASS